MSDRREGSVERILSWALTLSAIAIAASVALRTAAAIRAPHERPQASPAYVASWREVVKYGIAAGDTTAPVIIVEFVDLECPVCKSFHSTLKAVQSHVGNLASVVFVAYPLPQHRFALPAARAMECARQTGHAMSWLDAVLKKQDSIGLRSWGEFAVEAGIPDTASISRCARNPSPVLRIDSGLVLGERLGVNGTPTVFVNGWRMPGLPTREALVEKIYEVAGTRKTRTVP